VPVPSAFSLEEGGFVLAALGTIYLILRTKAAGVFASKLFNGKGSDGHGAGQASVEFWKITNREIMEKVMDSHERDAVKRHVDLREAQERTTAAIEKIGAQIVQAVDRLRDELRDGRRNH